MSEQQIEVKILSFLSALQNTPHVDHSTTAENWHLQVDWLISALLYNNYERNLTIYCQIALLNSRSIKLALVRQCRYQERQGEIEMLELKNYYTDINEIVVIKCIEEIWLRDNKRPLEYGLKVTYFMCANRLNLLLGLGL